MNRPDIYKSLGNQFIVITGTMSDIELSSDILRSIKSR